VTAGRHDVQTLADRKTGGGDVNVQRTVITTMAATDSPSAGALNRAREGDGFAQLVSAVESLRPGTRLLTDGQQTVLAEYEHIVEQLRPPTFSPPPPEISDFRAKGGKVKIFGKHLSQPVTVTIAGHRAPAFKVKKAGKGESPYIQADLPDEAHAGSIVVLTSGGSSTAVRPFRRAEMVRSAPPAADEPALEHPTGSEKVDPAPPAPDEPAPEHPTGSEKVDPAPPAPDERARKRPARRKIPTRARPNADKPAPKQPART
jgi:hypothetical protein